MSSFVIVHTTIKDPDKFQTYAATAGSTITPFGGEFMVKGKMIKTLNGEHTGQTAAVIKFPDQTSIETWYNSAAYQALIPNRDAAADMVFITYDEPPA